MAKSYTPLEQSSITSLGISPPSFNGATASFASTTSYIWVLCFSAIVIASFYRYAEAGVVRLPGSEIGIRKSNEILKKVTYGLLGVFSLWLILATVNRDMLRGEIELGGLKANTTGVSTNNVGLGGPPANADGSVNFSTPEISVRRNLNAVGITINKDACIGSNTSCTDVGGVNKSIIDMVISLKSSCSCTIEITGGSERAGHSTNSNHTKGEAVDIRFTDELSSFLKSKGQNVGDNSTCNTKYKWGGYIFWDEAQGCDDVGGVRHFHVSFTGR